MYSVYPQSLFHFTNSKALHGIVNGQAFFPSFSRERLQGKTQSRSYGVPVVSFCDLRLSEVRHHILSYGNFGIGLSKNWGSANGLSPVAYISQDGEFIDPYLNALSSLFNLWNAPNLTASQQQSLTTAYNDVMRTLEYAKNYEGTLNRIGKKTKNNFRFADEREWRYVPAYLGSGIPVFLPDNAINTPTKKSKANVQLRNSLLSFSATDVKYLLVKNDKSIPSLYRTLAASGLRTADVELLKSRVLTVQQIKEDV